MNKGYSAECFARRYRTRWSVEQCLGFLSRKNSYDLFEFAFEQGEAYVISFLWKRSVLQMGHRELNIRYRISFERTEKGAVLTLAYAENEKYPRGMLDSDLDEFFRIKLDAIPC